MNVLHFIRSVRLMFLQFCAIDVPAVLINQLNNKESNRTTKYKRKSVHVSCYLLVILPVLSIINLLSVYMNLIFNCYINTTDIILCEIYANKVVIVSSVV